MDTYRTFATAQEARDYRHQNGTGGWIFVPDASDEPRHYTLCECVLFPPTMTPSIIMLHPMTRGRSGALLAN